MKKRLTLSLVVVVLAVVGSLVGAGSVSAVAQERESLRPDLSGRWQLNRELSENAQAKLERMQSAQGSGHGPGRHGGGRNAQMEEARGLVLSAPSSFVVMQDGDRIVLTDSDGRVRTLTANARKEKVNGRDVQTKWDKHRLVSQTSLSNGKVTETYERLTNAPQLIVTTNLDMRRGHEVSVRRVYDAESPR